MSWHIDTPALRAVVHTWPPPYGKSGMNAALVSIQAKKELAAAEGIIRAAKKLNVPAMRYWLDRLVRARVQPFKSTAIAIGSKTP